MKLNLTDSGKSLLLNNLNGGTSPVFVSVKYGNGSNAGLSANSLTSIQVSCPIISITKESGSDFIKLKTSFNNLNFDESFRITETGVFVQNPNDTSKEIMFAYGYTDSDDAIFIPAKTEYIFETSNDVNVFVGSASNITATTSDSIVNVKRDEFIGHIKNSVVLNFGEDETFSANRYDINNQHYDLNDFVEPGQYYFYSTNESLSDFIATEGEQCNLNNAPFLNTDGLAISDFISLFLTVECICKETEEVSDVEDGRIFADKITIMQTATCTSGLSIGILSIPVTFKRFLYVYEKPNGELVSFSNSSIGSTTINNPNPQALIWVGSEPTLDVKKMVFGDNKADITNCSYNNLDNTQYENIVRTYYSCSGGAGNKPKDMQATFGMFSDTESTSDKDGVDYTLSCPTTGSLFTIGNGTYDSSTETETKSNAFRVSVSGKCYGSQSFVSSGAGLAEYWEWSDGNVNNEDRRGKFITLDGDKIRIATTTDSYILGVIDPYPFAVGDTQSECWQGMYLTDIFGQRITEDVIVPEKKDNNGDVIKPEHTVKTYKLNPDFDNTASYVSREERKEWSAITQHGKVVMIDDGNCQVNGFCTVGLGGIAIPSNDNIHCRVLERIDENHIKVFLDGCFFAN